MGMVRCVTTSAACSARRPGRRPRAAFTSVELLISMAILSVATLALGAIMSSVSQGWTAMNQSHGGVLGQHTAALRVERMLAQCRQVVVGEGGDVSGAGPQARVALWLHDNTNYGDEPELCETALLVHDRNDGVLYLYDFRERTLFNAMRLSLADVPALLPQLESLRSSFLNLLSVRRRVLATDVQAAAFWAVPAVQGGQPSVEFVLKTSDGRSVYGTATLRADK